MISFDIVKKGEGHMRTGVLTTPHGLVETPSYVIVGTHAEVRCLTPEDIKATGTQMVISNTYHLWRELGDEGLNSYQGVHQDMGWDGPIMTDSGGFQVFSLGAAREHGVGKVEDGTEGRKDENLVSVTDAGVSFDDGEPAYLDAELSIKIQEQLGADIMFAFDEPSSPRHDRAYTEQAMARTHAWATRSLDARTSDQALYGIVQGGAYEDLRKASATYIGKLPFDGFGIGGSFGSSFGSAKENTANELLWTVPYLPERKPPN
jgi:queuine tRNA-ribosyltransferase/7-cyano-7-deazaguanine tRNA-ribosyltransferase